MFEIFTSNSKDHKNLILKSIKVVNIEEKLEFIVKLNEDLMIHILAQSYEILFWNFVIQSEALKLQR